MKKIAFTYIIGFFVLFSMGCGKTAFLKDNAAVDNFIQKFNKEKFLLQVEEERAIYHDISKRLKDAGVKDASLIQKYTSTQRSYNRILDQMILDIKATKNILSFKLFDANSKYNEQLVEARRNGDIFLDAARTELKDESLAVSPFVNFAVFKVWPVIQKVQEKYLDYCKLRMESRINESKFVFYDDII